MLICHLKHRSQEVIKFILEESSSKGKVWASKISIEFATSETLKSSTV